MLHAACSAPAAAAAALGRAAGLAIARARARAAAAASDATLPAPCAPPSLGEGILAIKAPWPAMMRTVHGDHARFEQTYFSAFKVRQEGVRQRLRAAAYRAGRNCPSFLSASCRALLASLHALAPCRAGIPSHSLTRSLPHSPPAQGYYFTGDGCRRDADGFYWITGRVDDVINVSGHRVGTAEVESALTSHALCAEAAVIG